MEQEAGKTGRFGDGSDVVIGVCIELRATLSDNFPSSPLPVNSQSSPQGASLTHRLVEMYQS
jgi:hypothetical protein